MSRRPLLLISTLWLVACGDDGTSVDPEPRLMSVAAEAYLVAALDIMQEHSINRYVIDWPVFRQRAIEQAGRAQTTAQTYNAIRFALRELGDNHSFFRPPSGQLLDPPVPASASAEPSAQLLDDGIGYVSVTAFTGDTDAANALASSYHRMIEGVDTLGVCGWVVDLRGNTGGNMWPMIAGVGPVLGEGVLGFFVDPDSLVNTWTYEDGASAVDGFDISQASPVYVAADGHRPVAVLTDSLTASSGEATTIAFRGRPDTRSFGKPTWGVSTANRGFPLSDGAWIFLTVSTMADRTGELYGQKIVPDELVDGPVTRDPATDPPLGAGVTWLLEQTSCAS